MKFLSRELRDLRDNDVWETCELYGEYLGLLVGSGR